MKHHSPSTQFKVIDITKIEHLPGPQDDEYELTIPPDPAGAIAPPEGGDFPPLQGKNGCELTVYAGRTDGYYHPALAVSNEAIYISTKSEYFATGPQGCTQAETIDRVEVYRRRFDQTVWERIVSLENQSRLPALRYPIGTDMGKLVARSGDSPALAVLTVEEFPKDWLLLAREEQFMRNGLWTQKVKVYRLINAAACTPVGVDLAQCGAGAMDGFWADPIEADLSWGGYGVSAAWLSARNGVYQIQPVLVVGGGTDDRRVALYWYSQPYYGWTTGLTGDMKGRTVVEGVFSMNGGITFSYLVNLTVPNGDVDQTLSPPAMSWDRVLGQYFVPCTATSGYFGEYDGGAFTTDDPQNSSFVAAWGDSRRGCVHQSSLGDTFHLHVYGGRRQ